MAESLSLFRSFYRAIRFALPERRAVLLIVALTLLVAAANAAEPLVLKVIFDGLTTRPALDPLGRGLGILAVLALARESSQGVSDWLTWRTRIGLQYALLEATVGKLHNMPLRMQRSEGVGAIMTRLDRSIQGLIGAVAQMHFYDPIEGTIRLDGQDLRTLKQSSIRRHIGVVLQDPLLFNDSVRANADSRRWSMPTVFSFSRRAASSRWARTRSWSGGAVTTLLSYIGNTAASFPKSRRYGLYRLPRRAQALLELRELSGYSPMLGV